MSKIMLKCDCGPEDKCPQGHVASMRRCIILRDERIPPSIEPAGPSVVIKAIVDRLDEADAEAQRQNERIDNLEKHCEALQGTIEAKRQEISINRVYAGGWVNVYLDAAGPYFSRPWDSRQEAAKQADVHAHQIACILIARITDGDGL